MATHDLDRPEKCPVLDCDYHIRRFVRAYDRERHTLVHYKGDLICGFCPESRSLAEKSFRRADLFKRHLVVDHEANTNRHESLNTDGENPAEISEVSGKCSNCSLIFNNIDDFHNHFYDCICRAIING
ncbi:hypothetical protein ASPWEDRAFT_37432 [Aspergillus wentii DTO 134E9]|uniref:C2H2-type domain-containing protein n=1 Tax=Aspergillus wentii DTO 134E9 TaxID=1073089 RepID=A0A1L9RXF3_ASPWE|nr:uncharacterized protein ASPWEDRAFT_37432 [Aspergillus wentii DTO 134E9]OJJ39620.1 hypothetical protein ASPWEDRAFT_37432 [Aspergillus wentii DTO 134E9]